MQSVSDLTQEAVKMNVNSVKATQYSDALIVLLPLFSMWGSSGNSQIHGTLTDTFITGAPCRWSIAEEADREDITVWSLFTQEPDTLSGVTGFTNESTGAATFYTILVPTHGIRQPSSDVHLSLALLNLGSIHGNMQRIL
jgi:hypothetical protein